MLVKAINLIHRSAKSKPSIVQPGELVDLEGDELERVVTAGAAVEASKAEIALSGFKASRGKKAAPKTDDESTGDDEDIDLNNDEQQND